ncbi:DUF4011 domain-containing protein [Rhodopirellula sp. MGV]|uniref:DUF4011 domain-containing protein n=1 Tax=Rhodopirellula sp. MGV TaxID=2023130 RepID=UPI000B9613DA|nr:DUF4011 domain-containing protein [Rhodopirellula sp. MGV]OYP38916.1 hypothetical protein CGZ80_01470 [Rhodopirellula sp. MGV]PNY37594.1 DUF4011 domain-containing protein [Rhodopirellula baltica]
MSINLAQEIERFRERLLDLSLRNPLLSYRKSNRKTLQIVDELPNVIYQRLVDLGKPSVLDFIPDSPIEDTDETSDSDESSVQPLAAPQDKPDGQYDAKPKTNTEVSSEIFAVDEKPTVCKKPIELPTPTQKKTEANRRLFDDRLQTNLTQEKLNSTLRSISRDAKTAMEETGINYLFMAIGFLSWLESDSSDKERIAPLILIPVQIEKDSRGDGEPRFQVVWDEDEIQSNLCLQKKLLKDFDISLPEFNLEISPESYFEAIADSVKSKPRWKIKREALLGFFSFHKLSMYADIDPKNWDLSADSQTAKIIERMVCGTSDDQSDTDGAALYAPDYNVDQNETVERLMLPLDADSSQQSALVDIRNGRNLVIEGPPGTGKSQTITNAIADAIASGKTVLFVAEKLAALQVVHDRMQRLGLDDFCLELHSDSASPRHVFDALRERISKDYDSPTTLENTRHSLNNRRDELNAYVAEMSRKVGPYRQTLYDLLWEVILLRGTGASYQGDTISEIPSDRDKFDRTIQALTTFSGVLEDTGEPRSNPWWGFEASQFAFRQSETIKEHLESIGQSASRYRNAATELSQLISIDATEAVQIADRLDTDRLQSLANSVPDCDNAISAKLTSLAVNTECTQLLTKIQFQKLEEERLESEFDVALIEASETNPVLLHYLDDLEWTDGATTESSVEVLKWLSDLKKTVEILDSAARIFAKLGLRPTDLSDDYRRRVKVLQLIRHPIAKKENAITAPMFLDRGKELYRSAIQKCQSLQSRRDLAKRAVEELDAGTYAITPASSETLDQLVRAIKALPAEFIPAKTSDGTVRLHQWAVRMLRAVHQIVAMAPELSREDLAIPSTLEELERRFKLVQLACNPIAFEKDKFFKTMFRSEAKVVFDESVRKSEMISARLRELDSRFHMPSVPEPKLVTSIARALRKHRKSWLRVFSREFKEAKSQLDEFVAIDAECDLGEWIKSLEDLNVAALDADEFSQARAPQEAFGSGFEGIATSWESIEQRCTWATQMRLIGFDYERSFRLVESLRELPLSKPLGEIEQTLVDYRALLSESIQFAPRAFESIAKSPFCELSRLIESICQLSETITRITSQLNIPGDWPFEKVEHFSRLARQRIEIEKSLAAFNEDSELCEGLGLFFQGEQTDWKELETAFSWARTAAQFGLNADTALELLGQRDGYLAQLSTKTLSDSLSQIVTQSASPTMAISHLPDFARMDSQSCLQWLDQKARLIESAIGVFGDNSVTHLELRRRCDLTNELIDNQAYISDPRNWPCLVEAGLYELTIAQPGSTREINDWIVAGLSTLHALPEAVKLAILRSLDGDVIASIASLSRELSMCPKLLQSHCNELRKHGQFANTWLGVDPPQLLDGSTTQKTETLLSCLEQLPAWCAFTTSLSRCEEVGVVGLCYLAIDGQIASQQLVDCYRLSVLELAADDCFQGSELLKSISGRHLDGLRNEFQRFDRELQALRHSEIASHAARRQIPAGNAKGRVGEFTELSLIRHETQKQQRHCRIRDLLDRAGNAVQALKPCFMMSPLSVSRFVAENSIEFDLVIMDEASQIKPEDAIGTLLRAKQIVVVGDPKQLPPTSFFDKVGEDLEDGESTQFDNTESVLEASMKIFQPFRRLRWHYRSEHESLIHFSNTQFYDDDLVVFPSPKSNPERYGIQHIYVEDATCRSGLNMVEANRVVEEIVRHAMVNPDESLGVGTFNKRQSETIDELLQKRCESDPAAAFAVGRLREQEEDLFIKNLENLQGDERDVIFVCYTYGRDPQSQRLFQRFGPINSAKGWRRLNVLVTRSRKRMVVFHSIHPSEIQGGPDKSRGVNAYKSFLSYAVTGTIDESGATTGKEPDSAFEIAVGKKIAEWGLEAVPQVGVAGFYVDIGVRRRDGDRSFLLGIECDGATYHSAKSARDRDRLREEVIRSRGWNIHRIWSTDWFLNEKAETEKLRLAVMAAMEPGV